MRNINIIGLAVFAFAALTTGIVAANPAVSAARPNIIFILGDDLGKEWISCYGAEDVRTPNIDALAAGGMKFNNFYAMPKCTPTRVAMLTGKYPWRNGWVNHYDVPRWGGGYFDWSLPQNMTGFRLLQQMGYATAAAGKWQLNDFRIDPEAMARHGFDEWFMWTGQEKGTKGSGERYYNPYIHTRKGSRTHSGKFGPDLYCDFLIDFIRRHKGGPFCIYYPEALVHIPFTATPDEPQAKGSLDQHKAMVRYLDKLVGRIVAAVDEEGLRNNTIIIFTTDNGTDRSLSGHRNGRLVEGAKDRKNEAGTCFPFIVNAPGLVPAGVETNALADITDLLPTFVEFAGGRVPSDLVVDGVSLAEVARGRAVVTKREWIMSLGGGEARLTDRGIRNVEDYAPRVLRDKDFKVWVTNQGRIERLHDLASDPYEEENLIGKSTPRVRAALAKFEKVLSTIPASDAHPQYVRRKSEADQIASAAGTKAGAKSPPAPK